jgi:hypothetical protein
VKNMKMTDAELCAFRHDARLLCRQLEADGVIIRIGEETFSWVAPYGHDLEARARALTLAVAKIPELCPVSELDF